ncbi:hypothetical protein [Enterococcus sp. DIV0087]|uniref:hypothetical protein n=1 Tax=Enterococcus sp. DIV0087 TaxID=2774662 RepID=UPI003D2D9E62
MRSEKENKELLTKKNQPIKTITQQDINALEIKLEQLQSWTSTLRVLNEFFDFEKETINKKISFENIMQMLKYSKSFSMIFYNELIV